MTSIRELYNAARIAVAPIRMGAGVKNKTMEALQYGVPVVATAVGAEGMGLTDGLEIDVTDDPLEYARRIGALATDSAVWLDRARHWKRGSARGRGSASAGRTSSPACWLGPLRGPEIRFGEPFNTLAKI